MFLKVYFIVFVILIDDLKVIELIEERGCFVVIIMLLKEKEREDIVLVRKLIYFCWNLIVERLIG